ncbi:MAG: cupin domain-containing protein [Candidatus Binatia bacterium]
MTLERLTGSAERPLDAPLLTFDIPALLTQVKQESTWRTGSRNAITLLKTQGLRVVLVAMHAGTMIPSHRAEGPIAVQLLEGQLVFSAGSKNVTLAPAQLLTLQPGIPHDLEAKGECAFLLTIATETPHPVE